MSSLAPALLGIDHVHEAARERCSLSLEGRGLA